MTLHKPAFLTRAGPSATGHSRRDPPRSSLPCTNTRPPEQCDTDVPSAPYDAGTVSRTACASLNCGMHAQAIGRSELAIVSRPSFQQDGLTHFLHSSCTARIAFIDRQNVFSHKALSRAALHAYVIRSYSVFETCRARVLDLRAYCGENGSFEAQKLLESRLAVSSR